MDWFTLSASDLAAVAQSFMAFATALVAPSLMNDCTSVSVTFTLPNEAARICLAMSRAAAAFSAAEPLVRIALLMASIVACCAPCTIYCWTSALETGRPSISSSAVLATLVRQTSLEA